MFKTIPEFPDYEINQAGLLRHRRTKRTKYSEKHNGGYLRTTFRRNGRRHRRRVHRLVAEAFIPNPDNLPDINHTNGVKDDNRVENLEWITPEDNARHAWETGLSTPSTIKAHYATQLSRPDGTGLVCFGHTEFPPPLTASEVSNCINQPHKHFTARGWAIAKIELAEPIRYC